MSITDNDFMAVLEIMAEADNGCSTCAKNLFAKLLIKYPDKKLLASLVWSDAFPEDYDEVDWDDEMNLIKETTEP